MRKAHNYYLTLRGAHDTLAVFDAFSKIERVSLRPLLVVSGSNILLAVAGSNVDTIGTVASHLPRQESPGSSKPLGGATYIDLYDRKVGEVSVKLTEFFKKTCGVSRKQGLALKSI